MVMIIEGLGKRLHVLGSQRKGKGGDWVPGKLILDMGQASLETEDIMQQTKVFITQV
jgi:hypothetical protein